MKGFANLSIENEALVKKTRDFLDFLERCRDKSVYMPIHELLRETVIESGYLRYVTALPGGEQRRANVEILMEKAAAFEHTSYYGLFILSVIWNSLKNTMLITVRQIIG